jgi:hypothetical protein
MCVNQEAVVDVVLLVLVVEVELVVVELVVVVVVVEEVGGLVDVSLVLDVSVVTTCCWMNGSLLWKLEYESSADSTTSCPTSATVSTVVATIAWRRLLVVEPALSEPMHPARSTAIPAARITPARRCRCRCNFIFSLLYGAVVVVAAAGCSATG